MLNLTPLVRSFAIPLALFHSCCKAQDNQEILERVQRLSGNVDSSKSENSSH